jgi:predicted PurR-regulated permease PerM
MQNVWRSLLWVVGLAAGLLILSLFISVVLKLCVAAALLALAYYWYNRAMESRRNRRWR